MATSTPNLDLDLIPAGTENWSTAMNGNLTEIDTAVGALRASVEASGASVPSVFGRTGAVSAQAGDYSFAQIAGTVAASQLPAIPAADITGVLPIANGGTGATIAIDALENLGGAASGANQDITSLSALTSLEINGSQALTGVQGSTGTNIAVTSGSFISGNLRATDANGNEVDSGVSAASIASAAGSAFQPLAQKGQPSGYASLDANGLLPSSQLPPLAIDETHVITSQAAMLALAANVGDVAIRSDINNTFILAALPPSTLANWQQILTPSSPVQSVNGQVGNVNITASNITGFGTAATQNTTGSGAAVTTGPTTSTSGDIVIFTGASGQIADSGFPLSDLPSLDGTNQWQGDNFFAATVGLQKPVGATAQLSVGSPELDLTGSFWNGSASATDTWTIVNQIGNGTNSTSTLNITHSGTSGVAVVALPDLVIEDGANSNVGLLGENNTWTGTNNFNGSVNFHASGTGLTVAPGNIMFVNNGETEGAITSFNAGTNGFAAHSLFIESVQIGGLTFDAFMTGSTVTTQVGRVSKLVVSAASVASLVPLVAPQYQTSGNVASVNGQCGSAASGVFVMAANSSTFNVSTTAVTANSQIFLQIDYSQAARLGITINDAPTNTPLVIDREPGVGFTVQNADSGAGLEGAVPVSFFIIN